MGGTGSGRKGGRPTVESALRLEIYALFRDGTLVRGADRNRTLTWTDDYSAETSAVVVLQSRLTDPKRAHIRLIHRDGDVTTADYRVWLEGVDQPLGGARWWFLCPVTNKRVGALHLPLGGRIFASREAHRLWYYTQTCSARDRAIRRMHKMRTRLGATPGIIGPIAKPYRVRRETFERDLAKLAAIEAVACAYRAPTIARLRQRYST